ncbi:MAG: hypothetical protein ACRD15_13500 [Vicinamibacterales bacterium]
MRDTFSVRQARVLVLEAIEERVKQFRRREELWPLRVPQNPILLDEVIDRALPEGGHRFDPAALRTRTLLRLGWPGGSVWEAWMSVLPSGFKLYCDSSDEETRILASSGRNEGDESDRVFLMLLAESAGEHFGIEMSGGAPSRVRSSITDGEFLVELFVNLFEVTGAEDSVRRQLPDRPQHHRHATGADFRIDVESWLSRAMKGS